MARRKGLDTWIREALIDPDKSQPCSALSLVLVQGVAHKELHSKKVSPGMDSSEIATMFRNKAETYAGGYPGQTLAFAVLAHYGDHEEAVYPFSVAADIEFLGGTEAPNAQGEKQQSMRHNEMLFATMMRQTISLFEMTNRTMQLMSTREETLLRENHDMFSICREMIMQKATNDHELRMQELQFQRSTEERKKWMQFLPALVNTITGRELFPQGTADTALIESIADTLTAEHLEKIMGMGLPLELLGPLAERVQKHQEKKAKEQAAMRQLPIGPSNVELDE